MIYYRMLWVAAALTGVANFLVFMTDDAPACGVGAFACALVCWITFSSAWSGR